jgi:predicted ATPase
MRSAVDAEGRNVVEALIDDVARRGKLRGALLREVNRWLRTVGGVQLLPFRRLGRSARIYELRLKHIESGRWANFADVGSGIGQAFPVLVEGLRTPIGGTFLVQEPEIHLHPDAQLCMGDFLIRLAEEGRTVVAETHSENILLRIRRRIAERRKVATKLDRTDVSILFVDMDEQKNSIVKALKLDELGQIENWPKGFMEDATEERMQLLAAAASE